jgi:hypothetical protein
MVNLTPLLSVAAAAAVAVGASACGDNGEARPDSSSAQSVRPPARQPALVPFLMRTDEEPGFHRVEQPRTITGVEGLGSAGFPPADQKRLRRLGFVATAFQSTEGGRNAGMTAVDLYATADGAKRSMAYELRPSTIRALGNTLNRRFSVTGVPGARGWTGRDQHGNRIGQVLWVQGRCFFVLGNEGHGPLAGPLSAGANAIHSRTNGQCP